MTGTEKRVPTEKNQHSGIALLVPPIHLLLPTVPTQCFTNRKRIDAPKPVLCISHSGTILGTTMPSLHTVSILKEISRNSCTSDFNKTKPLSLHLQSSFSSPSELFRLIKDAIFLLLRHYVDIPKM